MTKHISDQELGHAVGLMKVAEARQKARLSKKARMIGVGKKCPRCDGPKPKGDCGKGISFSRRGRAAICAPCGIEEAMYDCAKAQKGSIPPFVILNESALHDKLLKSGGLR